MEKEVVVISKNHISDIEGRHVFTETKTKKFIYDTSIGEIIQWVKEVQGDIFEVLNLE